MDRIPRHRIQMPIPRHTTRRDRPRRQSPILRPSNLARPESPTRTRSANTSTAHTRPSDVRRDRSMGRQDLTPLSALTASARLLAIWSAAVSSHRLSRAHFTPFTTMLLNGRDNINSQHAMKVQLCRPTFFQCPRRNPLGY